MGNVARVAWQCERLGRNIQAVNARGIGAVTGQALARQLAPRSSVAAVTGVGGRVAAVLRSLGARPR
jgi:hypothetical protein